MTDLSLDLTSAIQQGATLHDLAQTLNCSWDSAAKKLVELGIPLPSMAQPTAQDLVLAQQIRLVPTDRRVLTVETLIEQLGYPRLTQQIDPHEIYVRFHGGYVDPYTGETVAAEKLGFINSVMGRPRNFLVSNMEVLSDATRNARFSRYMPPVAETFWYDHENLHVTLTISKQYDRLVGGTYTPEYVAGILDRWAFSAFKVPRDPAHEDVLPSTPFDLAWWAWIQITHYGLLKGLVELKVRDTEYGSEAVLTDDTVAQTLIGSIKKDGSNILIPQRTGPKFDPSIALR